MNIAFYVNNIADEGNDQIFDCINSMMSRGLARDASLFYNEIGPEPKKPEFGLFNATEIWHFTGHIISTTMENYVSLKNAVNKFKTKYLYNKNAESIRMLISLANSQEIIVKNEEDQKEVYRLTGFKPPIIDNLNPDKLVEVLNERV
jgi:hypothetical protein